MVFSQQDEVLEVVGKPCFKFYRDVCHEMGVLINEVYSDSDSGNLELPNNIHMNYVYRAL